MERNLDVVGLLGVMHTYLSWGSGEAGGIMLCPVSCYVPCYVRVRYIKGGPSSAELSGIYTSEWLRWCIGGSPAQRVNRSVVGPFGEGEMFYTRYIIGRYQAHCNARGTRRFCIYG